MARRPVGGAIEDVTYVWVLVFAVIVDSRAIGTQEMLASEFPRLRTVRTFSWLTRTHKGRGLGKEMRAAILHLAFEGLGAQRAESEAFEDNAASIGVSTALGYERNGTTWRYGSTSRRRCPGSC